MMARVPLAAVVFDAGTQIRAAIDQQVVADYAQEMSEGDVFPPIVLFHDGSQHYLADGFHRFMAAQRIQAKNIDAEVHAGTREDAIWFALGANRTNGKRLAEADKKHAIMKALETWPEMSTTKIADHIGCNQSTVHRAKAQVMQTHNLPDRVVGKDGKSYPASRGHQDAVVTEIVRRLQAHEPVHDIAKALHVGPERIRAVRLEAGLEFLDKSKDAIADRQVRMREMAADGYSSRQIAAALGMTFGSCRNILRKQSIEVPADRALGSSKRHDSNRILDRVVMDATNLTAGTELIDYRDVDQAMLPEWIASLVSAQKALGAFISRLKKEQQHGQVA